MILATTKLSCTTSVPHPATSFLCPMTSFVDVCVMVAYTCYCYIGHNEDKSCLCCALLLCLATLSSSIQLSLYTSFLCLLLLASSVFSTVAKNCIWLCQYVTEPYNHDSSYLFYALLLLCLTTLSCTILTSAFMSYTSCLCHRTL